MPLAQSADHRPTPNALAADHAPVPHPTNQCGVYWRDRWMAAATEAATLELLLSHAVDEIKALARRDLTVLAIAFVAGGLVGLALAHAFKLWG